MIKGLEILSTLYDTDRIRYQRQKWLEVEIDKNKICGVERSGVK